MNGRLRCGVSLNMNLKCSILLMSSQLPSWILFFPVRLHLISLEKPGFKKSWPGVHWVRLSSISLSLVSRQASGGAPAG